MTYKVSVIIPFYNAENKLQKAFDSIKNQTMDFGDIEVIFVNDCSTDTSVEIAKNFESKYDNCKFYDLSENYSEKSGYPGRPRNLGLKHVSSDYVIFLDADDIYTEEAFDVFYSKIVETKSDMVLVNHYVNTDKGMIKNTLCPKYDDEIILNPLKNQNTYNKITNRNFISSWCKIFNYNFINENNLTFFEDGPTEDADFYFKCLSVSKRICILPNEYLHIYNEYSDSTIHRSSEKLFLDYLKGLIIINDFLNENIMFSHEVFLSEYFSSLLLVFVTNNANNSRKKEFLEMIYKFEQTTDEINIKMPEVAFLNNLILKRRFSLAIFVGKLYNIFYNNKFIKKAYRKYFELRVTKD